MTSKVTLWIFSRGRSVSKIIISHHSTQRGFLYGGTKIWRSRVWEDPRYLLSWEGVIVVLTLLYQIRKKVESLKFCWRLLTKRNSNRTWYFDSHFPVHVRILILQQLVYVYISDNLYLSTWVNRSDQSWSKQISVILILIFGFPWISVDTRLTIYYHLHLHYTGQNLRIACYDKMSFKEKNDIEFNQGHALRSSRWVVSETSSNIVRLVFVGCLTSSVKDRK